MFFILKEATKVMRKERQDSKREKKMPRLVQKNISRLSANLVLGASSSVAVPLLYFGSKGAEQRVCGVILIKLNKA